MKRRALVVDLFGTVVPKWSSALSDDARRRMAELAGIDEAIFREAWKTRRWDRELGRITAQESIAEILEAWAPDASTGAVSHLIEVWNQHVSRQLQPRADVLSTLGIARAAGLPIGLVSNAGATVPALFRDGPLSQAIDCAVFSCTVGVAKPDSRIYLAVCSGLGVAPHECLYVGDGSDHELQGAKELGMTPVLLRIEAEIEREGLPPGAQAWTGQVIRRFAQICDHFGPSPMSRRTHETNELWKGGPI
jgi:putative hydrolase of the HAD superfamily